MLLHWQGWGLGAREWWGYQEWRHRMFSHVSQSWVPLEDTSPILMPGPVEAYLPGTQILKSCKVQVTCSQSCAWKGPVDSQKPILHLSCGALAARKSGAWLVRAARPRPRGEERQRLARFRCHRKAPLGSAEEGRLPSARRFRWSEQKCARFLIYRLTSGQSPAQEQPRPEAAAQETGLGPEYVAGSLSRGKSP